MGYYVPEVLKNIDNWLVWKLIDRNGKKALKVPFNPLTKKQAKVNNPTDFHSYDEVSDYALYGDYEGIGFVFTEEDNLVFIDLDNCLDHNSQPNEFCVTILRMFKDTYAEYSHSERGIHIVASGKIKKSYRTDKIEIYSSGRYMAFTGNVINKKNVINKQAEIDQIIALYINKDRNEAKTKNKLVPNSSIKAVEKRASNQLIISNQQSNDVDSNMIETLIEKIKNSQQGEKFIKLMSGDWSDYPSQSEADQSFINIVTYYCNNDDQNILSIWQRCQLSKRAKGKRMDYLVAMINNAKRTQKTAYKLYKRAIIDID